MARRIGTQTMVRSVFADSVGSIRDVRRRASIRVALFVAVIASIAGGCGPSDREINSFLQTSEASVSSAEYVVQPPDIVELSSAQATEIEGEQQTVRQD